MTKTHLPVQHVDGFDPFFFHDVVLENFGVVSNRSSVVKEHVITSMAQDQFVNSFLV